MKTKLTSSSYSLIVVIVIALVIVVSALGMPFASKLLPLIFGSTILILAAIKLWDEIGARHGTGVPKKEDVGDIGGQTEKSKAPLRAYLPIGGWVFGFLLVIYLLGFLIACPLLIFSYMKVLQ